MAYKQSRPVGFAGTKPPAKTGFKPNAASAPQSQSGFAPPRPEPQQQQQYNPQLMNQLQAQPQQAPTPLPAPNYGNFTGWDGEWTPARFAEWAPYGIQSQLGGLASQGIASMYANQPAYDAARMQALNALGPGGAAGLLDAFRSMQMAGANDRGRQAAATLRSMGIQGADAPAALDAQNQAANATNDYASALYSPEGQAQRAMQSMSLLTPEAISPILKLIMQLDSSIQQRVGTNDALHAQRAASSGLGGILGNVLGMASQFIPGGQILGAAGNALSGGGGSDASGGGNQSMVSGQSPYLGMDPANESVDSTGMIRPNQPGNFDFMSLLKYLQGL